MTLDIDAIRKRADAATPGPWTLDVPHCGPDVTPVLIWPAGFDEDDQSEIGPLFVIAQEGDGGIWDGPDLEFIATARQDVTDLLAEVDRLRMYSDAYHQVQKVLDRALGTDVEDGAGEGIAADVALVVQQRDEARADNQRLRDGIEKLAAAVEFDAQESRDGDDDPAYTETYDDFAASLRALLTEAVAR